MKEKILILCTGNSCRSQITEAYFNKFASGRFEAVSAGLEPRPVHPLTMQVLEEDGIDTSGMYSKPISEFLGKEHFRHVIFVCGEAEKNCPTIYPFALEKICWPFDDPAVVQGTEEEKLAKFRHVRDEIRMKIINWLDEQKVTH